MIADSYRCGNTIHSDYVEDHRCHLQKNHDGECSFGNRRDRIRELEVAHATVRWIKIKTQFEERYDPVAGPTMADVDHSALLRRLLEGKEPLPVPPPKQHSYPAYHLYDEDEPQYVHEVWFKDDGVVVIEQALWRIADKLGEENYIVEWEFGQRFHLYKKDDVKVGFGWKHGEDMDSTRPREIRERAWVIERL